MRPTLPAFVALISLAACGKAPADRPAADTPAAATLPYVPAAAATKTALTAMPWLIGRFRGVGVEGTEQAPFYERYSLANDSTLVVEGFADSTWSSKPDSTRYELRGDSIAGAGTAHYVASLVSPDSLVFSPRATVRNGFTWRRGDDTSWVAVITPLPVGSRPLRFYRMKRIK